MILLAIMTEALQEAEKKRFIRDVGHFQSKLSVERDTLCWYQKTIKTDLWHGMSPEGFFIKSQSHMFDRQTDTILITDNIFLWRHLVKTVTNEVTG